MKDAPNINQAEITLIGTGGGYGECIVCHLGSNEWIVIDSCINPITKSPLALEYFEEIGVDVETQIKLIVCTHWHDDHIQGISTMFDKAKNSRFAFLRIHDREKFFRFISFDYNKIDKSEMTVSTKEMFNVFKIQSSRKPPFLVAGSDKILYRKKIDDNNLISVFSLSPSDQSVLNFDKEITGYISNFSYSNLKIPHEGPNTKSIVILLQLCSHGALLGADLEVVVDPNLGWNSILNFSQLHDIKSSYFKVSHHGSENAHHEGIWNIMLKKNPVATISPWNRNTKLPKEIMLKKFCSMSDKTFLTSPIMELKPKKRTWDERKQIEKLGYKPLEIKFQKGIIRSRINICEPDSNWETITFDSAYHVNLKINS